MRGGTSFPFIALLTAVTGLAISLVNPELIQRAQRKLVERRGTDWVYVNPLATRTLPLDYRR